MPVISSADEQDIHKAKVQLLNDQVESARKEVEVVQDKAYRGEMQSKKSEQEIRNLNQEIEIKQVSKK